MNKRILNTTINNKDFRTVFSSCNSDSNGCDRDKMKYVEDLTA